MIAPLETKSERRPPGVSPRLRAARSVIAAMLLGDATMPAPPIAAWKAWLFVAWLLATGAAYAVSMSGMSFVP